MASIFKVINEKPKSRYNYYRSMVVVADTLEEALNSHPNNRDRFVNGEWTGDSYVANEWSDPRYLKVVCVCKANGNIEKGALLTDFHSG